MSASITITRSQPPITAPMQSYDMTVAATAAAGMSLEVFVFKRMLPALPMPGQNTPARNALDEFIKVADPVDLEELPVDMPDMEHGDPRFRTAIVTFRFRCLVDLEETWVYINEDLQGLVNALNVAEQPGTMEAVTIS